MRSFCTFLLLFFLTSGRAQTPLYYPPLTGPVWDTTSPTSLGWCPNQIDSLYQFLSAKHTKAFLVLKDGRIVLEKYFGTFTADSIHMWASAGKTLTAFVAGIAQQERLLDINQPTAAYLGTGWTFCPPAKEALITVRHQLTMTTGIDDRVPDLDCTLPSCLTYRADAGNRWAYHNALYTLVQRVVDSAAGPQSWQQYFNTRLAVKTGIIGAWVTTNSFNSVFYSKARSAARFGLLLLGRGIWNTDTVLRDTAYFNAMTRPSQMLNPSYGYLTWLNGQSTYRLPGLQIVYAGPLFPDAPQDVYAALGKDDQKIYVSPSKRLVVVRMGDAADSARLAASAFDNELWVKLNAAMCSPAGVLTPDLPQSPATWTLYPQPTSDQLHISGIAAGVKVLWLHDLNGQVLSRIPVQNREAVLDTWSLPTGQYVLSDGKAGRMFRKE
jgi:CubicO group peptidase (beta-lactamase class C family)